MTQRNNILQELNELKSSLANMPSQNIYSIPDGYFDSVADRVLNRIKAMKAQNSLEELTFFSPVLSTIPKQMPYSVPDGYFEELEEKLMQSVRERSDYQTVKEELEMLSPLLSGLKKQTPYGIPQGYFENLPEEVNAKTNTKRETKVVLISSRKLFRYAAAAIIVGIVSVTGFLLLNKKSTSDPIKSFARFEKKLDKEIKTTSDKELKEFVQQFTDAGLTGEEKVQTNPKEVKDMLNDVPDTELKKFLEETSDPDGMDDETIPIN